MRVATIPSLVLIAVASSGCNETRLTQSTHSIVQVSAQTAVMFDAAQGANDGAGSVAQLTGLSISGSNRLLICVVSIEPRTSAATVASAVVDDGAGGDPQSLQQLGAYYSAPSDGLKWSTWYVTGADIGVGRRVLANFTQAVASWEIACDTYTGVHQATPFGVVTTASGTSGPATLRVILKGNSSWPWGHLFSSNAGYVAGTGVVNRQKSTTHPPGIEFSYLVDAGSSIGGRDAHTFHWDYNGQFGGQGAAIRPAGGDAP